MRSLLADALLTAGSMANHAESFHFNARFVRCYPCLLPRDRNLLFHGVHAFEVRQQQPAAMPLAHDHAVFLRVELGELMGSGGNSTSTEYER